MSFILTKRMRKLGRIHVTILLRNVGGEWLPGDSLEYWCPIVELSDELEFLQRIGAIHSNTVASRTTFTLDWSAFITLYANAMNDTRIDTRVQDVTG